MSKRERPAWDQPESDSDGERSPEDATPEEAAAEFASLLTELWLTNQLKAHQVCNLAFWATRAGVHT